MAEIEFYRRANGSCPYEEYLDDLIHGGNKKEAIKIGAVVERLRDTRSAGLAERQRAEKMNDVWQLRIVSHRIFYFLDADSGNYVILNGFRKQSGKTPPQELQRAENLRADHLLMRRRR